MLGDDCAQRVPVLDVLTHEADASTTPIFIAPYNGGGQAGAVIAAPDGRPLWEHPIDKTVTTNIHSRPFAATVKGARLIVLPGVGHMVQYAAPDLVVSEIEAMAARIGQKTAAAAG